MPDVRSLIETAQTKGLRLFLKEGRVKVQAPSRLDGDMKALIEKLREHREQIKSILTTADSIQLQDEDLAPIRAWVVEVIRGDNGKLRAVLIYSGLLEAHFWMIRDRSFQPNDGMACYFAEEIPLLKGKSIEDLKLIHQTKLIFPGARLIQEGAEAS